MPTEIRAIAADELRPLGEVLAVAFGEPTTDESFEDEATWAETDRMLGAVEDGRFVGAAGAYSFTMTVPGGAPLPVAGVTWVGVLPTHRRRGVLTEMMRFQLDDVATRGEAVAVLNASEAAIYGRFGYGLASRMARVRLRTDGGLALVTPPTAKGRMRIVDAADALVLFPPVYDAMQRRRVGELSRPATWWTLWGRDRERWRDGATARFHAVHEADDGTVDGYVAWRIKEEWDDDGARSEVRISDLAAVDDEVDAALLAFLADVDLTASITQLSRPLDDPFPLRVADWRRYATTRVIDHLWLRVLDVPAALGARTYGAADEVVLEVADPFRRAAGGRFRLEAAIDGGACRRVDPDDVAADITLDAPGLGSLYLGDVRPSQLAAAGRLRAADPDALDRADRVFATARPPFATMGF